MLDLTSNKISECSSVIDWCLKELVHFTPMFIFTFNFCIWVYAEYTHTHTTRTLYNETYCWLTYYSFPKECDETSIQAEVLYLNIHRGRRNKNKQKMFQYFTSLFSFQGSQSYSLSLSFLSWLLTLYRRLQKQFLY